MRPAARLLRGLGIALVMGAPVFAVAELSDDPLLGLGLRSRPAYDGSADQHSEAVPVLRYFGRYAFARSTQGVLEGGLRVEVAPGLHAGAQLAYEAGRRAGESDFLASRAVPDIGRGASAGVQLEWDHSIGPMPFTLLTRLRKDVDARRGLQTDVRLSAGIFRGGPVSAGLFAQAIRADSRSVATYYGVSAEQATSTGLPAYAPGGGWLAGSGGLLWSVDLGRDWVVVGSVEQRRLLGDAARSPLVEQRSSHYLTAGIAHRL